MIDVTFVPAVQGSPPWVTHVLDEGELARLSRLQATGRPLFLAAHIGARMLVALRLSWATDPPGSFELDEFGWATESSGKPRVTFRDGRPQPLHVSVSHAGGMAVAAICDHGPIGVDIEHVDTRRNLLALARRFFSTEEHDLLADATADERAALFHQWWTRKEAVLKTTGAGLRGGLTVRVDAPPDGDGWRRVHMEGRTLPVYVRDLRTPDAGVLGAVAIEGRPAAVRMADTWLAPAAATEGPPLV